MKWTGMYLLGYVIFVAGLFPRSEYAFDNMGHVDLIAVVIAIGSASCWRQGQRREDRVDHTEQAPTRDLPWPALPWPLPSPLVRAVARPRPPLPAPSPRRTRRPSLRMRAHKWHLRPTWFFETLVLGRFDPFHRRGRALLVPLQPYYEPSASAARRDGGHHPPTLVEVTRTAVCVESMDRPRSAPRRATATHRARPQPRSSIPGAHPHDIHHALWGNACVLPTPRRRSIRPARVPGAWRGSHSLRGSSRPATTAAASRSTTRRRGIASSSRRMRWPTGRCRAASTPGSSPTAATAGPSCGSRTAGRRCTRKAGRPRLLGAAGDECGSSRWPACVRRSGDPGQPRRPFEATPLPMGGGAAATEIEWERAAKGASDTATSGSAAFRPARLPTRRAPAPDARRRLGGRQVVPAIPGSSPRRELGEYNGKFMSGQMVLRAGRASPPSHIAARIATFPRRPLADVRLVSRLGVNTGKSSVPGHLVLGVQGPGVNRPPHYRSGAASERRPALLADVRPEERSPISTEVAGLLRAAGNRDYWRTVLFWIRPPPTARCGGALLLSALRLRGGDASGLRLGTVGPRSCWRAWARTWGHGHRAGGAGLRGRCPTGTSTRRRAPRALRTVRGRTHHFPRRRVRPRVVNDAFHHFPTRARCWRSSIDARAPRALRLCEPASATRQPLSQRGRAHGVLEEEWTSQLERSGRAAGFEEMEFWCPRSTGASPFPPDAPCFPARPAGGGAGGPVPRAILTGPSDSSAGSAQDHVAAPAITPGGHPQSRHHRPGGAGEEFALTPPSPPTDTAWRREGRRGQGRCGRATTRAEERTDARARYGRARSP